MSLLEDIYLEDEAVDGLERVIEGDEYDDDNRVQSENESEENKEGEEDDKRKVDPSKPKKREIKNPRVTLNPARLTGPRGIHTIQNYFTDFKFQGKGREKEDLDVILKKLEHWAHRLFPKFQFDDCLEKIETLGKKRAVMTQVKKIRFNLFEEVNDSAVQKDSSDEENTVPTVQEPDEFDKLLEQQIVLARSTPAPINESLFEKNVISDYPNKQYPMGDESLGVSQLPQTPTAGIQNPEQNEKNKYSLSEEQKQRMLRNRILAEERRLAKMKAAMEKIETNSDTKNTMHSSVLENPLTNTEEIEMHDTEKQNYISEDLELNTASPIDNNVDMDTLASKKNKGNAKQMEANNVEVMDLDTISEGVDM